MKCLKCGNPNPPGTKFCGECGASVRDGHAERRQLTVCFFDIVDSTALAQAWDPEELRELYGEYQEVCADVVRRYDGFVAQYLGDGILTYFGYPIAHEDNAERAVRAGLDILQDIERITLHGQRPHVRIGIHTGLVVVGDVGSGDRREQLALGEAPNIAARIQSEAEPDTMVISEATRRLLGAHFALEDMGARELKGIARPMNVYRVLGINTTASRFDAEAASRLAPFIGREREVDAIRAAWTEAAGGAGCSLLLRGEAGIGKSRLLGVARQSAFDRVHELYEAECSPYDAQSALHPMTKMLVCRLGLERDQPSDEKIRVLEDFVTSNGMETHETVPLLAALLGIPTGDRYADLDMPPARRRERTLEILGDMLLHPHGGMPVVLLIEDLHWSDPSTLQFVGSLVMRQPASPLFMVCTSRPDANVPFPNAPNWRELHVSPLASDDARALAAGVAHKPLPEEVMQQVVARTEGIPLFVEAVTRSIIEAGVLVEHEDRYELVGPLPPGLIPATVHDSLMARIDRLGTDKPIAQLAATIGREFSFELLLVVSGKTEHALRRALDRLVELELVSRTGDDPTSTFTFKHALIQDAAYESLLRKTRQEYHARIGEVLVRFKDVAETRPDLVAQHLAAAGLGARAVQYWLSAGKLAQGRAAFHESIAHLKRGLEHIDDVPENERLEQELEFQAALAPALTATQGWASPELDRAYRRAGELVDLVPGTPHRLPVLWGTWAYHFVAGRVGDSLVLAPQVLDMATAAGVPLLLPPARHATACSHCYHGDFHESVEHSDAGLALFDLDQERLIARNFGHASSVCLFSFRGDAKWMLGYPDQALTASDASLDLARQLKHMPSLAWAVSYKTWFHHLLRDADRIIEMAEEAVRLSSEEGFAFWEPMVAVYHGWALTTKGQHEEGIARMRDGLVRYRAAGNGCTQVHMLGALAEALWMAGKGDEALEVLIDGMALARSTAEGFYEPELYRLQGQFLFEQANGDASRLDEAAGAIREAIERARRQDAKSLELRALTSLLSVEQARGHATDDVRRSLQDVYDGFTEGHDTHDLAQARAALAAS